MMVVFVPVEEANPFTVLIFGLLSIVAHEMQIPVLCAVMFMVVLASTRKLRGSPNSEWHRPPISWNLGLFHLEINLILIVDISTGIQDVL